MRLLLIRHILFLNELLYAQFSKRSPSSQRFLESLLDRSTCKKKRKEKKAECAGESQIVG